MLKSFPGPCTTLGLKLVLNKWNRLRYRIKSLQREHTKHKIDYTSKDGNLTRNHGNDNKIPFCIHKVGTNEEIYY